MKKTILIMVDWYIPGYKAGGPITACHHLARLLQENYRIFILTTDRDLKDGRAYEGIPVDTWVAVDGVYVYYASPTQLRWSNFLRQIRSVAPSCIYLNSMFSRYFTIYPLLMKVLLGLNARIILSPRGMLRQTALAIKPFKKSFFLFLLRSIRIEKQVGFHATDPDEEKDIARVFGKGAGITRILDIPPMPADIVQTLPKTPGELRLIFVGRIHPVKNLHFLLAVLRETGRRITLTVIGPPEDREYERFCRLLSEDLPGNIQVDFEGELPHREIRSRILQHHFFVLPTSGENYGYGIVESFCAGRPVIITDQTPWRCLEEKRIGWDLPVGDMAAFCRSIRQAADMTKEEFTWWSACSLAYAHTISDASYFRMRYSALFDKPANWNERSRRRSKPTVRTGHPLSSV